MGWVEAAGPTCVHVAAAGAAALTPGRRVRCREDVNTSKTLRRGLNGAVAVLLAAVARAQSDPELVAVTGTPAPGVAGATHVQFNAPHVTADGQVAYSGQTSFTEYGVTHEGLWLSHGGVTAVGVVDAAGATATHFNFTTYGAQALGGGVFAYEADYQTIHGYFRQRDGVRAAWGERNAEAPGTGGAQWDFLSAPVVGNAAGELAVTAVLKGPGVTGTNAGALYRVDDDGATLLARQGDAAPGFGSARMSAFYQPRIDAAGRVTVFVHSSDDVAVDGVWRSTAGGALEQVVGGGQAAPGIAGGQFDDFADAFAVNGSGRVALTAQVSGGGVTTANRWGLWTNARGALELVARTGDTAPGALAANSVNGTVFAPQFGYDGTVRMNDVGHLAFSSGLANVTINADAGYVTPASSSRNAGLWHWADGVTRAIAIEGAVAEGFGLSVVYNALDFATFALNANDLVVFAATVWHSTYIPEEWGMLSGANDGGLFVWSPGGGASLLLREGQELDLGGGDVRTVAGTGFNFLSGQSGNDGASSSLNDDNLFAALVNFTDGSSAIYRWDLSGWVMPASAVPEPAAWAAWLGAVVGGMAWWRRRR